MAGSGHDWGLWLLKPGVLALEAARVEEEASVKEKDRSVPLYKGCEYQTTPLRPQKLACFQGVVPERRLGYPRPG